MTAPHRPRVTDYAEASRIAERHDATLRAGIIGFATGLLAGLALAVIAISIGGMA